MNDTRSIPALATAGVTLAAAAPALAIGAAIGLGLLWLFRDDEEPQTATATPGNEPPAPDVATPARPVTVQAAAPQAASPKFSGWAPKVNREDLAAIFGNGAKRLTRSEAVAALMAKGVKKSTAYHTLRHGGRFSNLLEMGADGLLTLRV